MNEAERVLQIGARGSETAGVKPRTRRGDIADSALQQWAAWAMGQLDLAGSGGVDTESIRIQRGGHSDPILAEVIATEADGQDLPQRVHRHLLTYSREISREWFAVTWARYVGTRKATAYAEQQQRGTVEVARGHHLPISLSADVPRAWRWSGMLAWEDVARVTGVPMRTAKEMLASVKRELRKDLLVDSRISAQTQALPVSPA